METDPAKRKLIPVYSGFVAYFPDAIVEVAKLSLEGNEQHNPGSELHWDRSKSGDELDALMRHVLDGDWRAVAWRAMANLQKEVEWQREYDARVANGEDEVRGHTRVSWQRHVENSRFQKNADGTFGVSIMEHPAVKAEQVRTTAEMREYIDRLNSPTHSQR